MSGINDFKDMMASGEPHSVQTGTVVEIHADVDGIFLDVDFGPDEEPISCEWINLYAGKDFGLYLPVSIGDYVTVFIPDGDTCGRPFSFGVMNDEEVTIPQDVLDNPDDVWLIMKEGQNVRIRTSGDANETSIQSKMVKLGSETDSELDSLVKWSDLNDFLGKVLVSLGTGSNTGGNIVWGTPLPTAVPDCSATNVKGK